MSKTGKVSGEEGWAAGMHAGSCEEGRWEASMHAGAFAQKRSRERPLKWICGHQIRNIFAWLMIHEHRRDLPLHTYLVGMQEPAGHLLHTEYIYRNVMSSNSICEV